MLTPNEVIREMYAISDLMTENPELRRRYMAAVADVRQMLAATPPTETTPEETFLRLADKAETIIAAHIDGDFSRTYTRIFSTAISRAMYDTGLTESYYDPDTTYEEDVLAFMTMVRGVVRRLREKEA